MAKSPLGEVSSVQAALEIVQLWWDIQINHRDVVVDMESNLAKVYDAACLHLQSTFSTGDEHAS